MATRRMTRTQPAAKSTGGWPALLEGFPWFVGDGNYRLPAYSEFMPPPRLGRGPFPYSHHDPFLVRANDPWGWHVSEIEEEYELRPGLEWLAEKVLDQLQRLGRGEPAPLIAGHGGRNLVGNPYWPGELQQHAGRLGHERYVLLLPLALSRTQDDKGRIRWTFFGGSEQGPEKAFWRSFSEQPGRELPANQARAGIAGWLAELYGEPDEPGRLKKLGFAILPTQPDPRFPHWSSPLPKWTSPFVMTDKSDFRRVKYLLTFRPFASLPAEVRQRYLAGQLHLLPFPGSLVFWGIPSYVKLHAEFPYAMQTPLQRLAPRSGDPLRLRVPQSGWLNEPRRDERRSTVQQELLLNTYRRTNRFQRVHRFEDATELSQHMDGVTRVLFSTELDAVGLYGKPMARNCQIWTEDSRLLLDGPRASAEQIRAAADTILDGGDFRYRFQWPPMRVGQHELYWHRPLVAFAGPQGVRIHFDRWLGYLTAYRAAPAGSVAAPLDASGLAAPIELWPRLARRDLLLWGLHELNTPSRDVFRLQTPLNVVALVNNFERWGEAKMPRSLATALLRIGRRDTVDTWLDRLPASAKNRKIGERVRRELEKRLVPRTKREPVPEPLTLAHTATREFECGFWEDIVTLAHGDFLTKENADSIDDAPTKKQAPRKSRDLERLGDFLMGRHRQAIARAAMQGRAVVGDLPFRWDTDFDFQHFGGWRISREGGEERNLMVVIPGRNRGEAVVLCDHYDTAYMEDVYSRERGGTGARLCAAGADDNCSATACLLQAAPVFLAMSAAGQLERDVWLLHLTGEEFPADCLGARDFARRLVERNVRLRLEKSQHLDLSETRVVAVYDMDMIAHNRRDMPDIVQIAPGRCRGSLQLAYQALQATLAWNQVARTRNRKSDRRGCGRGERSEDPARMPALARHLEVVPDVRSYEDPSSSLFNTDGQIFADIGVPCVLFMENYDINRSGYHDMHDTVKNIDLDYGSAFAAIAIETVARIATRRSADS